jgi:putative peptidoglycan lipid II flippase
MSVLYQHGKFDAFQAMQAGGALKFYAVGLAGYAALKVLVNAFYALDHRKTPMVVSFLAVGLNLFFNWLFTFHLGWGHRGLAFSTGCVATCNFLLLYALMHRHLGSLESRRMLVTLIKIGVAGCVLAAVCWASTRWLLADWATQAFWSKASALFGTVFVAGAAFLGAAVVLKIEELTSLLAAVRRRLRRAT